MQTESSRTARRREPVYSGKRRVTGLWLRHTADGRRIYELQHRIGGRMCRTKLQARTAQEAVVEARGLGSDLERGVVQIGDRTVTVEALAKSFLEREKGPLGTRSARTIELYEQQLNAYVVPLLGPRTKATDIDVHHLRRMFDRLRARKLSGSTIKSVRSATSAMFRHAERDLGAIPRNPVRDLDRGDLPSAKRQSEPRYLTVEQVEALLSQLSDESRPIAAALFWGALRISEALALRWCDVDFDAASIDVPGTKTEASAQSIPLLPALARELRGHRSRQAERNLAFVRPNALVFSTRNGKPIARRNAFRAVANAARAAGLVAEGQEPVGLHDLRHSLAANAFALGLSPVEVARLLRHASPAVTTAVYAGITDKGFAAIGEKFAAGGFGA